MSIILSSIKRNLRDKNIILANIFLVLVLPYIFSILFSTILTSEIENEKIDLNIVGNKNSEITKSYITTLEEFDKGNKEIKLTYKTLSKEEYDKQNKLDTQSLSIIIDEKNKDVRLILGDNLSFGESAIQSLTEEYFNSMSIYESIIKEGKPIEVPQNIVKTSTIKLDDKNINEENRFTEEYFSVVMLQMAILALSMVSFNNTFYIKGNIGKRVKSTPIKISKLMTLEALGSFIAILLQGVIMLGGIGIIYKVNINMKNILPVLLLISVLCILAVSMGVLAAAVSKKKTDGDNICSIIVTIMVLISGQLMPQAELLSNEKLSFLRLNPFAIISEEMNSLITLNTSENLYSALGVGLIVSVLIMILSVIILKRKVVE